ncbi:MAG TPA: FG-GAP-like repeat-containing protein [Spirochaetota bacterium]|nr:FG-GAP-like repeat-containing protein [Spirochaetota bacterium]HPL18184.1 FG-GAP-like repeat-containing protein [Spirochaetota bacterium]HQJ72846.1 FG-GAP-like repeat-containing protein [Spirochaetota bacterium]HRS79584.1 FG-GAP-like repeat-containing protein [Spirochaetota bacterium]HRT77301.1 FG-GAP-like repeat-containing protein [Spirochaetota bacterium]
MIAAVFCGCSNMMSDSLSDNMPLVPACTGSAGGRCIPPVRDINPVIEWEWPGSTVNPTSIHCMSSPVVVNLNDDNGDGRVDVNDIPDVVFVTFANNDYNNNGTLRAISGDGGVNLFPVTGYNISPSCNIAAGDIDGDGLPEIVVREGSTGGAGGSIRLLAFNNDGTFLWRSSAADIPSSIGISIADINRDGSPEILTDVSVLDSSGTLLWSAPAPTARRNSCIVNLDLSGDPEVVIGNTAYRSNGTVYWQNASMAEGFTAAGNFDSDPNPELILVARGTTSPQVFCLEHTGQVKWGPVDLPKGPEFPAYPPYSLYGSVPAITDADGDGEPEIAVTTAGGLFLLETGGSITWRAVIRDYSSGMVGCTAFDFDEDGKNEIVLNDEHNFRIFRGTDGAVLYEINVGSGTLYEMPVIADVDGDSQAEIVVAANSYAFNFGHAGIVVFGDLGLTWPNTMKVWNQGDYHITNCTGNALIPVFEAAYWQINNSYRQGALVNPVSGSDLSISAITVDATAYPSSVELAAAVRNNGPRGLSSSVIVAFYNGDPSSGGTFIGRSWINPPLGSCSNRSVALTWTNPPSGPHTVYAVADSDGHGRSRLCEGNKSNNTASVVVTLP